MGFIKVITFKLYQQTEKKTIMAASNGHYLGKLVIFDKNLTRLILGVIFYFNGSITLPFYSEI